MQAANRDTKDKMWHTSRTPSFTQDKHHKEQLTIQESLLSATSCAGTTAKVMMRNLQNTLLTAQEQKWILYKLT